MMAGVVSCALAQSAIQYLLHALTLVLICFLLVTGLKTQMSCSSSAGTAVVAADDGAGDDPATATPPTGEPTIGYPGAAAGASATVVAGGSDCR